jgi:alanine dehydrogenase
MEITALRTGAATAVAARHLARADARVATVVGCGRQGRVQIAALARVRALRCIHAVDADPAAAARFATELSAELGVEVHAAGRVAEVAPGSDIVVTCTPSRAPLLHRVDVVPGTYVAAVGADNEHKQELEPALMAAGTIVVDSLEQCAAIGDLRHALAAGAVSLDRVHAELAQVVAGQKPGRRTADEIIIFDSTGVAIEDVAAAAAVYEKAVAAGRGLSVDLAS